MSDPDLVFVDFEARSLARLKGGKNNPAVTGRRYAEHPSTQAVCACWAINDDTTTDPGPWSCDFRRAGVYLWLPSRGAPPRRAFPRRFRAIAHNARGIDIHMWRACGFPEPTDGWGCTSEAMRVGGFAQASIEHLGELTGFPKDKAASNLTIGFSRGRYLNQYKKTGEWLVPPKADLRTSYRYCAQDVQVMRSGWYDPEVNLEFWSHVSDLEVAWCECDAEINDRGILFDQELARAILEIDARVAQEAIEEAGVDAAVLRSNPKFRAEMARRGVKIPNAKKETIEPLQMHARRSVRLLAIARQAVSSIAAGKVRAGLARVSPDSVLRDNLKYFGAHTGREAGQGLQPQNLTK